MMELLNIPQVLPFTVALALVLLLALVEVIGLLLAGAGPSHLLDNLLPDIDVDVDVDLDHSASGVDAFLAWFKIGELPALLILIAFLLWFGLVGLGLQWIMVEQSGAPLHMAVAVVFTLPACLPLLRFTVLGIARIMPGDETEAVSREALIGRKGTLVLGTAQPGSPAQAKVTTENGQTHYVMVEPEAGVPAIAAGEKLELLTARGNVYTARRCA